MIQEKNHLTIKLDQLVFLKFNASAKIEIYKTLGQLVLKEQITSQNTGIDTKDLCEGVYVLNLINEEKIISKKIVKQ